ncbi:MAG: hypothetical protein QNK05_18115 [Myxococcota bacterium]|nr:hypothetical protein [Myxococcota bacterium]
MKRTFRLVGLAALVSSASAAIGFGLWRLEIDELRQRVSQLERRNAALEGVIATWPEELRGVRTPLRDRIRELEQEIAARDLRREPADLSSEAPELLVVAPEPAPSPLPSPEVAPAEVLLPPVSAAPDDTGPADCSILIEPRFVLEAGGSDLARFGGRLRAGLLAEAHGNSLHVAGDDLSPYRVDGLPLHVAWECDGLPYVISLCFGDERRVEGVVSLAGFFDAPCAGAGGLEP